MWLLVFLFGLVIGSFLNAYIFRSGESAEQRGKTPMAERGTTRKSVWRGRSCCPKCGKTLAWYELIPLASFIIQKGRCRGCEKNIDWQYPIVELMTALLFILAFNKISNFQFPISNQFLIVQLSNLILLFYYFIILIILFVYDLRYGLVPNRVVIPGIITAFVLNVILSVAKDLWRMPGPAFAGDSSAIGLGMTLLGMLLAIAVGALFFAIQYYASHGRWVGAGDIYFGALMGAILGWPQVIVGLVLSYLIGGIFAAFLLLTGKKHFGQTLPMGTFLAVGTIITLLWGEKILNWYLPL